MDNATTNNVNNTEDANKNAKRLFALVESSELQDCLKRIIETKRRVEKLCSTERASLSEHTAERVRQEQEAEAAQRAAEREAERVALEAENKTPEPVEVNEVKESEPVAVTSEKDTPATTAASTAAPAPAEQQAESSSGTRTAIPSYIRGVIKHTPRPVQDKTPRGDKSGPRSSAPQRDRNGAHSASPRPASNNAPRPSSVIKFEPPAAQRNKREVAGKKTTVKPEDKRQMNKRTLIRKGYIQENMDEERMGTRKLKNKKVNKVVPFAPIKIEKAVITTENLTVKILSE